MSNLIKTPVGILEIKTSDEFITGLNFSESKDLLIAEDTENYLIRETKNQLAAYFEGKLRNFDLPISLKGTPFREKTWNALIKIPYGEVISYKELALSIENPKAVRAVGGANNKNPIVIIVPCHRVIGADGKLVGYGGGLSKKKFLLNLEGNKI